jgi:hypothetical protein
MSDGDGRATLRNSIESKLNNLFALRINSTGGLVEYDDLWFLDYTSCDGDSLFLTSGKFYTTVANFCVIPLLII